KMVLVVYVGTGVSIHMGLLTSADSSVCLTFIAYVVGLTPLPQRPSPQLLMTGSRLRLTRKSARRSDFHHRHSFRPRMVLATHALQRRRPGSRPVARPRWRHLPCPMCAGPCSRRRYVPQGGRGAYPR